MYLLFNMAKSTICNGFYTHSFTIILQKNYPTDKGVYFNYCVRCGKEEVLPSDMCVYDLTHKHDYSKYSWIRDGYYIFRCSYYGCDSLMRLWKNISAERDYHYPVKEPNTHNSSSYLTNEEIELTNMDGDFLDSDNDTNSDFVHTSITKKNRNPNNEMQQMEFV